MIKIVMYLFVLLLPTAAAAQRPALSDKLNDLSFLAGHWEGEGWIILESGRHTFYQLEHVYPRVDGELLVIEGEGYLDDSRAEQVHNAHAVVSYDHRNDGLRMHAYRSGGYMIEAEAVVEGDRFVWIMTDAQWGTIRYTITLNEHGQWFETGEASRDGGETWFKFFEMTLDRVAE